MAKTIFISATHIRPFTGKSRTTIWAGTLEELKNEVFGYTLECGASWSSKVNQNPKTAKSLITNLNKACEVSCRHYQDTYYSLATDEEIAIYKANRPDNVRGSYTLPKVA